MSLAAGVNVEPSYFPSQFKYRFDNNLSVLCLFKIIDKHNLKPLLFGPQT